MKPVLYFDYNATTPVDPRVLEAMLPYFSERFGNSMSLSHEFGWAADDTVEKCRREVAELLSCRPSEIVWTSGATESNNWAIRGVIEAFRQQQGPTAPLHILSSNVEHASVLETLKEAQKRLGVEVEFVPVDAQGRVSVEAYRQRLKPHTRLICQMWVQNEFGTIYPLQEIGELCRQHQIYFLSDATQALGKLPIDLAKVPVDLMSFSAHKLYGPKGIGFLYRRRGHPHVDLLPLLYGGGHERGERSGTLNVPGLVGLTTALKIALAEREQEMPRLRQERDRLWTQLRGRYPDLRLNGPPLEAPDRIATNLNLCFPNSVKVPPHLPGLAFSRGSACHSGKTSSSPALRALGLTEEAIQNSFRLSLGRPTQSHDINQAIEIIEQFVK